MTRRRHAWSFGAGVLLLAFAAGCSAHALGSSVDAPVPSASPPTAVSRPATASLRHPGPVDRRDPDAVAVAALTALHSYDTRRERRPADAARRAVPWLSDRFAAMVRDARPVADPGAAWRLWSTHAAVVTATVAPAGDDRPADDAQNARRQYAVEQVPAGRDGWRGPAQHTTVFVTLTRTRAGWLVDQVLSR